jgi:hypothetical protein
VVYGVTLLAAAVMTSVLWRYSVASGLLVPDVEDERLAALTERLTPVLAVYGGMIALAFVLPGLAVAGYLGVALYRLVPVGFRRR